MLKRLSRTKPSRVKLKRCAVSTARLEGAPTAARIGMPAMSAFCTSSKLARLLTNSRLVAERRVAREHFGADQFVDRVVTADVFAQELERSIG